MPTHAANVTTGGLPNAKMAFAPVTPAMLVYVATSVHPTILVLTANQCNNAANTSFPRFLDKTSASKFFF